MEFDGHVSGVFENLVLHVGIIDGVAVVVRAADAEPNVDLGKHLEQMEKMS